MGAYTETYGVIGGVMVLMLWFYISGLVILIGAEMNAEIEHASPYGKEEGEKVPGEKRKIGAARMRAWMEKRRQRGAKPPSADEVKQQFEQAARPAPAAPSPAMAYSAPRPAGGAADYLIGAGIVLAQAFYAIKSYNFLRRTRRTA
jgi:membrane protein